FCNVQLQFDSITTISAITGGGLSDLRHSSCIDEARELLSRDWLLGVIHTFCEGNRAAYCLAYHGYSLSFGFHSIPDLPREVTDCIRTNLVGVYFLYQVPMIN
ncbi:hypothetical protein LINGRAHAP2_LOCUS17463, partial [Linum grandiflorum]